MDLEALRKKKLFCLDMDGTIYLDCTIFDGTLDLLKKVRARGGKILYLTNNSSKGVDTYVEKLSRIGIPALADDFITSTDATVAYIRKNCPDTLFYVCGTASFVRQLRAEGVRVVTEYTEEADGVITSNDTEINFEKMVAVSKILTLRPDSIYLATNPDPACPASFGYVPDCGSFTVGFFNATGRMPLFIGKPQPEMLLTAMDKFGYRKEETVMVGDMLGTDILAGNNAGVDSILLFSGGTSHEKAAASEIKPTYAFENIRELCDALGE